MIRRIHKLEDNVFDDYESITVTVNNNDELSLSI